MIAEQIAKVQAQVGEGRVICGLSGGVDSSVAALLVHRAVGERLTCVFVDHGLMRLNEAEQVVAAFEQFGIPLVHVEAEERFLAKLAGVDEPERKRKIIGEEFIRVFEEEAEKLEDVGYLVQGTLYSDVIESRRQRGRGDDQVPPQRRRAAEEFDFELVEPLRMLFKDEVRAVGAELGLPDRMVWRQPFPGRAWRSGSSAARSTGSASTSSAPPTRSSRRRSAPPSSTASSGSPSASCRSSARSASRGTAAPTPTRS